MNKKSIDGSVIRAFLKMGRAWDRATWLQFNGGNRRKVSKWDHISDKWRERFHLLNDKLKP